MRNEIGNVYGRLTVLAFDHKRKGHIYYKCACSCGCVTVVEAYALRTGRTTSCGCYRRELGVEKHLTHGYSDKERLYNIWIGIKQRCYNHRYRIYKWYGGKGIKLCDEWMDYAAFRAWAYENGYSDPKENQGRGDSLSIDRIDPSKDYCPENCRWISLRENVSHMQKSKLIRGEGESQPQRIGLEITDPRGRDNPCG